MRAAKALRLLGLILSASGLALSTASWLIVYSVPLLALGLGYILVGATCLALSLADGEGPSVVEGLRVAMENLSVMVEGLGARAKAIYVPSSMCEGGHRLLLPSSEPSSIRNPLPNTFIARYGPRPEDLGVLVKPPAEPIVRRAREAGAIGGDVESSLNAVLAGTLGLADSFKAEVAGEVVTVEASRVRVGGREGRLVEGLAGSLAASAIASVVCESLQRPIVVEGEDWRGDTLMVRLRVLGHG